jgi:hypothetical protein
VTTDIEQTIASALQELIADVSRKPHPQGRDTYICDLMYHALRCWSCGWTGAVIEIADIENVSIGVLFTPRADSICPACGDTAKRILPINEEQLDSRRGLRLV